MAPIVYSTAIQESKCTVVDNIHVEQTVATEHSWICWLANWGYFELIMVPGLRWARFDPAALNTREDKGFRGVVLCLSSRSIWAVMV